MAGDSDADATRETYIPFFVTPRRGSKRETVAFLAPTCSFWQNHIPSVLAAPADPKSTQDPAAKAQAVIDKAVEFLKTQQQPDGQRMQLSRLPTMQQWRGHAHV